MKVTTPITFDTLAKAAHPNKLPQSSLLPPYNARSHVLQIGALTGQLCSTILTHAPLDNHSNHFWNSSGGGKDDIASSMGLLLVALLVTAKACCLDLKVCILKKIELNGRKYPVHLCKGKSGKYTKYSTQTGITKDNQSTDNTTTDLTITTVEQVTDVIRKFATDRTWSKYHTPRNIVLALLGEVGELAELFQWRGDGEEEDKQQQQPESSIDGEEDEKKQPESPVSSSCSSSDDEHVMNEHALSKWSEEEIDKVSQELADVSIYLLRLADVCQIDIGKAALRECN